MHLFEHREQELTRDFAPGAQLRVRGYLDDQRAELAARCDRPAYRIEEGSSATKIVATVDNMGALATVDDGEPSFRIGWSNVVNVGDF